VLKCCEEEIYLVNSEEKMNKYEFLEELRGTLAGEIPQQVIAENIRFYEHYIDDEERKGKSEETVLDELGSPRLIARTIMDTWQSEDTDLEPEEESRDYTGQGTYWNGDRTEEESFFQKEGKVEREKNPDASYININGKEIPTDAWYLKAIPIVVAVLIILFIGWILGAVLHVTVSLMKSPVFWILILVVIVMNVLRWRK
jgi:hypothetical protein